MVKAVKNYKIDLNWHKTDSLSLGEPTNKTSPKVRQSRYSYGMTAYSLSGHGLSPEGLLGMDMGFQELRHLLLKHPRALVDSFDLGVMPWL